VVVDNTLDLTNVTRTNKNQCTVANLDHLLIHSKASQYLVHNILNFRFVTFKAIVRKILRVANFDFSLIKNCLI